MYKFFYENEHKKLVGIKADKRQEADETLKTMRKNNIISGKYECIGFQDLEYVTETETQGDLF